MRLRTAVVLICLVLSLVATLYGGYSRFNVAQEIIVEEGYNNFKSMAELKKIEIEYFIETEKNKIRIFRTDPLFLNFLMMSKYEKGYNDTREIVKKRIQELNQEIGFLDKNGIVIISQSNPPGENYSALISDWNLDMGIFVYYNFFKKDYFITVLSEVINPDSDERIGFVGFEISLDKLNKIVYSGINTGKMGEIYLINKGGILLTPLRFVEDSVFVQKIDTFNSKTCFLDEENGFEIFLNHRGEETVGVHEYLPINDWCLIVETEKKELFGKVKDKLLFSSIFISLIIIFSIVLFGFFIGNCMEDIYLKKKKYYKICVLKKISLGLSCKYYLLLSIIFSIIYFFIVTSFFQGWGQAKFFDIIPDSIFLIFSILLLCMGFKMKDFSRRRFIIFGATFLTLHKLIEIPLQEYQNIVGILGLEIWIFSILFGFFGFLLILMGFGGRKK